MRLRLVVVLGGAAGLLAFAFQLGHAGPSAGESAASAAATSAEAGAPVLGGRAVAADAQRSLESTLSRPGRGAGSPVRIGDVTGRVVDESQPHVDVVDPSTGGLVPVAEARGVIPHANRLGAVHLDPMPPGSSLSDPTDTASLLRRDEVVKVASALTDQVLTSAITAPVGTPDIRSLSQHVLPSCSGTGTDGKRVQALYVRETTTPSRFTSLLPVLRDEVANVDDVFAVSSDPAGGSRRVRWVHDADCQPVIQEVVVPSGALGPDFWGTVKAVQAQGYNDRSRKYVMFADANQFCGIGTLYSDASAASTNQNNGSAASFARIDANCWSSSHSVAAHELTHTLGGVQSGAPHATANGHCWDESDIMCYDDGSGVAMKQICPSADEQLLDCNHDDYFATAPTPGSWLATHWNTANSGFLDVVPADGVPSVRLSSSVTTAETGDVVRFTASSDQPVGWTWSGAAGCTLQPAAGTASMTCPATVSGPVRVTVTGRSASGTTASDTATVTLTTAAAPVVTVTAPASATAGRAFPVTAGGTGKAPFTWTWSATSGCVVAEPAAASTTVTCPAEMAAQQVGVTARGVQADGQGAQDSVLVAVSGADGSLPGPAATSWSTPQLRDGAVTAVLRTPDGVGLAGVPVVVEVRWFGTAGFVDVGTATTDATGAASTPTTPTRAGWYRFRFDGDAQRAGATSASTYVKVATRTTGRRVARHKVVARLQTVSGSSVRGARLVLQRRAVGGTRWVAVRADRTDRYGHAALRVRPHRLSYYRWVFRGEVVLDGSASGPVAVRR